MKPMSPELLTLLSSRVFFVADLYTFDEGNLGANVLRYTSGDQDVVANGFTYLCGGQQGPYFDRKGTKGKCHWKIGVDVDSITFDIIPGSSLVLGVPWSLAVQQSLFDNVEMTIERAYMPVYGDTSRGTVIKFVGRVGTIDVGRSSLTFVVNSHLELLAQDWPRNLYQPGCLNNLFDVPCGVSRNAFSFSGAVSSVTSTSAFASNIAEPNQYCQLGSVTFTSGNNAGLSRTVTSQDSSGNISVLSPFPNVPAVGDKFVITAGCDKTLGPNGCPKFNNVARYRGFPFIPAPETAI